MAVDCHFHVIGPPGRFPQHPGRSYTAGEASLAAWRAAVAPLGVEQGVLVQPSVYGTDHRALLATLQEGAGRLVGVGALASDATEAELDALTASGLRGLRFGHFEPGDRRMMPGLVPLAELAALAPRMKARALHVDLFTDSRLLDGIAPALRAAGLPVVLDHMGRTPAELGIAHEGMDALAGLLDEGWLWVKLSGLANVSRLAPGFEDARPMHAWLVERCPQRLVWGSDWPHTRPSGERPSTARLAATFEAWTPSATVRQQILVDNPRAFYRLPALPAPAPRPRD
ncbi:amidohydrolase family protein [Piscinibacter sakaiensis]|uniref:Putative 2-pyrone-4,6-dicarboxylic acid hydrolase n=1 Tax=Piscinibacter sakaiensis TaxID=1547922 RepID=A0A0K8NWK5_PISS1|nr:amidohydrolase family protein [Piscinibacter sakaiensis]GAP34325.1 putative 2-pyrone-4,6-dicarboxylic acid hydrolase [Piscinibacter sakaiensis]